jgi:glucose/arabinose dehydrogenase
MKPTAKHFIFGGLVLAMTSLSLQNCKKADTSSSNDDLTAAAKSVHNASADLQLLASGFRSPLGVVPFPDMTGRLAVIDQAGQIRIITANGTLLPTPFIDVANKMVTLNPNYDERGLLGLAFHPDYAVNGKFYLYYTAPPNPGGPTATTTWNNLSTISEFKVSMGNPNVADLATERFLLRLNDPQSNHNGGTIAFGEDGYLYIAIGDGGAANDVAPGHVEDWYAANAGGNAQNIEANLFGKILRIDVNTGNPYGIPSDNPFVGKTGLDEIYAYGFRNPYRFSFDMGSSNDLIAGDAGQLMFEEIDVVKKGGNYGWNVKEGFSCFNAAASTSPFASCPNKDIWNNKLTDPVIELTNVNNPSGGEATTIIGGNVYRGDEIKSLKGLYVFGIFSSTAGAADAELYVAKPAGNKWKYDELSLDSFPNNLGQYVKGFGQDLMGEIYVTTSALAGPQQNTGKVYKMVPGN